MDEKRNGIFVISRLHTNSEELEVKIRNRRSSFRISEADYYF